MDTVNEFAKRFDLAVLAPNARREDILAGCATAASYQVNSINVNSCWIETAKEALQGTGVSYSAVIGFPFGAAISKVKFLELEEMLKLGCGACDMVINVGALRDGNLKLVENEVRTFAELCEAAGADSKLIFEVGFLTQEEIALLTRIACANNISYVKTATGTQTPPDLQDVLTMKANLSGHTKLKVSGLPKTFSLAAAMFMFEHLGVSLIGTRGAAGIIDQYRDYLEKGGRL